MLNNKEVTYMVRTGVTGSFTNGAASNSDRIIATMGVHFKYKTLTKNISAIIRLSLERREAM